MKNKAVKGNTGMITMSIRLCFCYIHSFHFRGYSMCGSMLVNKMVAYDTFISMIKWTAVETKQAVIGPLISTQHVL